MDTDVVSKFRAVLRNFERELDIQNNNGCCCGITLSQCHALMELSSKDHQGLTQLSQKLSVDKSAASRTIDNLTKKGMVERKIPENNRRATILSLTKSGKTLSNLINESNNDYYYKALGSIHTDDLIVFLRVFEDLAITMKELNGDRDLSDPLNRGGFL